MQLSKENIEGSHAEVFELDEQEEENDSSDLIKQIIYVKLATYKRELVTLKCLLVTGA